MLCRDVMSKDVAVCRETDTVDHCARVMRDRNVGFLPVVDARGLVNGLVTDRDLTVRVLAEDLSLATPVGTVMTRDVRVCRSTDPLRTAERHMAEVKRSRLVVVDAAGRCVGVISLSDVAEADTRAHAGHLLYEVTQGARRTARTRSAGPATPPRAV
jgi:CBS domain-containing protein